LAFWGYVIARLRRWRHPWRVALGSLLAGVVTLFAGAATGGYIKGTPESVTPIRPTAAKSLMQQANLFG
jgi:hypothetical protein